MTENEITSLDVASLEQEYSKTLQDIQHTKKEIVDLLTLQVTVEDENDTDNFIGNSKESIKSLDKKVTESDLSKQLTEKNSYLKKVTQELEKRRNELFDNFDATLIPLYKLSTIESFLSQYQKSEYKEKMEQQIKMAKIDKIQQLNMNTSIYDGHFSVRLTNCLKAVKINTLGDLIKIYQIGGEKELLKIRNFGKGSLKEIQNFLQENKFIN